MEAGVGVSPRREIEIDNIDRYHIRQFLVILPLFNAFGVHPAPVEHTAPVNIILIAELYFDVYHCTVRKDSPDIEDAGFAVDGIRRKRFVFEDFDGLYWFFSRVPQDGVQEAQQLLFIAFFAHDLVKKVVVKRVDSLRRLKTVVYFHISYTARTW